MKYQIIREDYGKETILKQCDFVDTEFKIIAQNPRYKILCNGKDVTEKYRAQKKKHNEKDTSI